MVAEPLVQVLPTTVALVTWPIRALATLWMVNEWKLPSSARDENVAAQSGPAEVEFPPDYSEVSVADADSLAKACVTAIESSSAALRLASTSLLRVRMRYQILVSEDELGLVLESGGRQPVPRTRAPIATTALAVAAGSVSA